MINFDEDLSELEQFTKAEEIPPAPSDKEIEDKAVATVREAMKNVIQEIVLIDKSGKSHISYVTKLAYEDGNVVFEFCTPSEEKDIVEQLTRECLETQIKEVLNRPKKSLWNIFK
ncbi:hypothetical protein MYO4S_00055 [Serratia phage 4S]|nr:hypothetical protein MYO4S_00055 [Serratia phage 4S]